MCCQGGNPFPLCNHITYVSWTYLLVINISAQHPREYLSNWVRGLERWPFGISSPFHCVTLVFGLKSDPQKGNEGGWKDHKGDTNERMIGIASQSQACNPLSSPRQSSVLWLSSWLLLVALQRYVIKTMTTAVYLHSLRRLSPTWWPTNNFITG